MKKCILISLILIMSVSVSHAGILDKFIGKNKKEVARETVKIFWENTLLGKYKEAEEYLSKKERISLNVEGQTWEGVMRKFFNIYQISDVEVLEEVEEKVEEGIEVLYVNCKMYFLDRRKNKKREGIKKTKLVKENGSWKIADPI